MNSDLRITNRLIVFSRVTHSLSLSLSGSYAYSLEEAAATATHGDALATKDIKTTCHFDKVDLQWVDINYTVREGKKGSIVKKVRRAGARRGVLVCLGGACQIRSIGALAVVCGYPHFAPPSAWRANPCRLYSLICIKHIGCYFPPPSRAFSHKTSHLFSPP